MKASFNNVKRPPQRTSHRPVSAAAGLFGNRVQTLLLSCQQDDGAMLAPDEYEIVCQSYHKWLNSYGRKLNRVA